VTLVLGAGLVGAETARQLVEQGKRTILADVRLQSEAIGKIVALDKVELAMLDALSLPELLALVRAKGVDEIVHTAALISFVERPYYGVLVNCVGTLNILEAARLMDLEKVVFTSSHSVYRTWKSGWQQERQWDEDTPLEPVNLYAATKGASDLLGQGYHAAYGVNFVSLRFPFIFGPWSGSTGGTLTGLLYDLLRSAARGENRKVTPSFHSEEILYSKDVATSLLQALQAENLHAGVFIIGMGRVYAFKEILETINRLTPGSRLEVVDNAPQRAYKGFALRQAPADISLAGKVLGFKPRFSLESALRDYSDWCRMHRLL